MNTEVLNISVCKYIVTIEIAPVDSEFVPRNCREKSDDIKLPRISDYEVTGGLSIGVITSYKL